MKYIHIQKIDHHAHGVYKYSKLHAFDSEAFNTISSLIREDFLIVNFIYTCDCVLRSCRK